MPKASGDPVCLCSYGRTGILCDDAVNITHPLFGGTDEFGFTSFLAYSTIQNISFSYEFRLKFTLADGHSAIKDNLIFFTGQNGHGLNGDDFLLLGLRNGSIVYSFNLGSGTTVLISEPLDRLLKVHVIHLGRFLKTGWLKVDNQGNKTSTSTGTLTGLNVLSQIYVGGYREYTPELLPNGTHFSDGFQGNSLLILCLLDFQVINIEDGKIWLFECRLKIHPTGEGNVCSLLKQPRKGMHLEGGHVRVTYLGEWRLGLLELSYHVMVCI
ncbi:hypothetical protein scyTo_0013462 [Scyliorhinus torazame]|uniref:Laminin G domain-containing protein n=1 Tax=Scyliorhinus torazame TaxID=75743 RepID=A0A401NX72_SCYTO|nr:hypothetical protein [Scyliorhinus torazame]